MPVYSHQDKRYPGCIPFPFAPCYALDANGEDVGDCVMVDTDTGRCDTFARNSKGEVILNVLGDVIVKLKWHPLPIRFFPGPRVEADEPCFTTAR